MIEIKQGHYSIPDFRLDINLNVRAGEFCAVLGPSGAGKSTLLSIIAGFEGLKSGSINLDNFPASPLPALRPVSMIFQDHNVFAHLNVWTNVALGISPALRLTQDEKTRIESALTRVGLAQYANRKPGDISGGERQRIALARVLVRNRPILLLDEPFAALDPGLRIDMMKLVRDLQDERKLTVMLVTHNPEDVKSVVDKVVFVSGNRIQNAVTGAAFFSSRQPEVSRYLGQ
jgi:thiamine transport system ATP-binding protein